MEEKWFDYLYKMVLHGGAFESIENDLIRIVEYIPLETKQYNVYSFQLSDIIKRTCSQIDSVFKEIVRVCELEDYPDKKILVEYNTKNKISILDHAKVFSDYYTLQTAIVVIRKNLFTLKPFSTYENILGCNRRFCNSWNLYIGFIFWVLVVFIC